MKQTTIMTESRNTQKTINLRFEYSQQYRKLEVTHGTENFIIIDEVGFKVSSRPKRGRSIIGSSSYVNTPTVRCRNISLVAAMNKNSMIFNKIHDSSINGENSKESLKEIKTTFQNQGIINPIFIMDNSRIHNYSGVKELINELKITVLYLHPYSFFLKPIENCFSKWKNDVLRKQVNNENDLMVAIIKGFEAVTQQDCEGYCIKMLRYIILFEHKEFISE